MKLLFIIKRTAFFLLGWILLSAPVFAEDIELATAYPSPYGVYKELRAEQYCDENGANCFSSASVQRQVVYGATWPLYRKTTPFTWNSSVYAQIRTTFTKAELMANVPELSAETRDVLGIIVNFTLNLDTNTTADGRDYRLEMVPLELDAWPNGYYNRQTHHFFWYAKTAATTGTLSYSGSLELIDYINNDEYSNEAYFGLASYLDPSFAVSGNIVYEVKAVILR